jgi:hypothetical protein
MEPRMGAMWIMGNWFTSGRDVGNWFTSGVNVDSGSLDHYMGDANNVNWNHEWGEVDNGDWTHEWG